MTTTSFAEFFPLFPTTFIKTKKFARQNWEKLTGFWEKLGKTQNSPELLNPLYLYYKTIFFHM